MDRKAQTGTDNRNQVAVISNSSIYAYGNPAAATIGSSGTGPSVALTLGNQYTETVRFTLQGSGALQLDSNLYDSANTALSTMTATTATTPLTTTFDALSIGWRANPTTGTPSTIDISSIQVTDFIQTVPEPGTMTLACIGAVVLTVVYRRRWAC